MAAAPPALAWEVRVERAALTLTARTADGREVGTASCYAHPYFEGWLPAGAVAPVRRDGDVVSLRWLAVTPGWTRRGVGRALVEAVTEVARGRHPAGGALPARYRYLYASRVTSRGMVRLLERCLGPAGLPVAVDAYDPATYAPWVAHWRDDLPERSPARRGADGQYHIGGRARRESLVFDLGAPG